MTHRKSPACDQPAPHSHGPNTVHLTQDPRETRTKWLENPSLVNPLQHSAQRSHLQTQCSRAKPFVFMKQPVFTFVSS